MNSLVSVVVSDLAMSVELSRRVESTGAQTLLVERNATDANASARARAREAEERAIMGRSNESSEGKIYLEVGNLNT
jgi:hypothetical protein